MFQIFDKITVCPLREVPIYRDGAHAIISIGDRNPEGWLKHPRALYMSFNDQATLGTYENQGPNPTPADVERAVNFAKEYGRENLLVHCQGGISRSPAIAMACAIGLGHSLADIGDAMPWGSTQPNVLIVKYTDAHFDLGGKFIALVSTMMREDGRKWRGDWGEK